MSQAIAGDKQIDKDFVSWIQEAETFIDELTQRGNEFALTNAAKRNLNLDAAQKAAHLSGRLQGFAFDLAMTRIRQGSCSGASKALREIKNLRGTEVKL